MLTPDEEKYLEKIPAEKTARVVAFDPRVQTIIQELMQEIRGTGITSPVVCIGSAALQIPGQGDIDLHVFATPADYPDLASRLDAKFGSRVPGISIYKWLLERGGHEVELYLSDPTSASMLRQLKVFDALQKSQPLQQAYAAMKQSCDGLPFREYMRRKYDFFHKILGD